MNQVLLSPEEQLDMLIESARVIASDALFLNDFKHVGTSASLSANYTGAYIPLLSEHVSVDVGVSADSASCRYLAGALMCMEDEQEILEMAFEDVADALGEVANLIAGGFKSRLSEAGIDIHQLGTPMVVQGRVLQIRNQTCSVAVCTLGKITAELLILRNTPSLQITR